MLLGFSAFLLLYSLSGNLNLLYSLLIGCSVLCFYSWHSLKLNLCIKALVVIPILTFVAFKLPVSQACFYSLALLFSLCYSYLRNIPYLKALVISLTWSFVVLGALTNVGVYGYLVNAIFFFTFFFILSTASDYNSKESDPSSLKTLPQLLPWTTIRWLYAALFCLLTLYSTYFLPAYSLGSFFVGISGIFLVFIIPEQPFTLNLDPLILIFALGNICGKL